MGWYLVGKQSGHHKWLKHSDEREHDSHIETIHAGDVTDSEEGEHKEEQENVAAAEEVERQVTILV